MTPFRIGILEFQVSSLELRVFVDIGKPPNPRLEDEMSSAEPGFAGAPKALHPTKARGFVLFEFEALKSSEFKASRFRSLRLGSGDLGLGDLGSWDSELQRV